MKKIADKKTVLTILDKDMKICRNEKKILSKNYENLSNNLTESKFLNDLLKHKKNCTSIKKNR